MIYIECVNFSANLNVIYTLDGNKYVLNNGLTYDANKKYGINNGIYEITNIPQSHPLAILNNDKETSKIIEDQAIGRSVRIGQKNIVHVQRFIMRDTIEHDFYIRNISD